MVCLFVCIYLLLFSWLYVYVLFWLYGWNCFVLTSLDGFFFFLQARSLEKQCETRSQKIQECQQQIEETWSLAKEEASKCKAAKEVIKALALRVNLFMFHYFELVECFSSDTYTSFQFSTTLSFISLLRIFELWLYHLTYLYPLSILRNC